jgi:hypothetical protein
MERVAGTCQLNPVIASGDLPLRGAKEEHKCQDLFK